MILRSPHWLSLALAFINLILQFSSVYADADFESVRIGFDYPYSGGRGGDPKEKYWRKSRPHALLSSATDDLCHDR